jgi:hypothetical protein
MTVTALFKKIINEDGTRRLESCPISIKGSPESFDMLKTGPMLRPTFASEFLAIAGRLLLVCNVADIGRKGANVWQLQFLTNVLFLVAWALHFCNGIIFDAPPLLLKYESRSLTAARAARAAPGPRALLPGGEARARAPLSGAEGKGAGIATAFGRRAGALPRRLWGGVATPQNSDATIAFLQRKLRVGWEQTR